MRLWHKDLISVLPKSQLSSQWRECCGIVKNIYDNGTPNHILVNPIMDYNYGHFLFYTYMVIDEMTRRKYKVDERKFLIYYNQLNLSKESIPSYEELFKQWHNERYLDQCYYNLQEKFDRGGINKDEWKKVEDKYKILKERLK